MKNIRYELENNQKELLKTLARENQEQLSGGQAHTLASGKGDDNNTNDATNLNYLQNVVSQPKAGSSTGEALTPGFRWNHNETIVAI